MMPDLDHSEAHPLLGAAFDNELDGVTAMRVEAHMATCTECAREYAQLSDLAATIQDFSTRHVVPDQVRRTLTELLKVSASTEADADFALGTRTSKPTKSIFRELSGAFRNLWRPAAGFALGGALAASVAVLVGGHGDNDLLIAGIVTAHIRALQPGHLTDVQVSDRHQVKPWFDGKIDFAPPVKDLTPQGFELAGGRLDYLNGHPAAVVVYKRNLHIIDLFVSRADAEGSSITASKSASSGYNVERWRDTGLNFAAVSDLNAIELADFAAAWKR